MPTGRGPPKGGHTKGGNRFIKELWASACSCDCHKAGERDCRGTVNFRRREWRGDSALLLKDTQKEKHVRGKCVPCEGWEAPGPEEEGCGFRDCEEDWPKAVPRQFDPTEWRRSKCIRPYIRARPESCPSGLVGTSPGMDLVFTYNRAERFRCLQALKEIVVLVESDVTVARRGTRFLKLRDLSAWQSAHEWDTRDKIGQYLANYIGGHVSYGRACVRALGPDEWSMDFMWVLEDQQHPVDFPGLRNDCWIDSSKQMYFRWEQGMFVGGC